MTKLHPVDDYPFSSLIAAALTLSTNKRDKMRTRCKRCLVPLVADGSHHVNETLSGDNVNGHRAVARRAQSSGTLEKGKRYVR